MAAEKAGFIPKVKEKVETFPFNASVSRARIPVVPLMDLL
jgi:hypothetical protein